ncbi:glycoside hydrolase family 3 protein [Pedobacter deserti]|uniref:glycoside hydrolase family 3 protein n=1 Tax=Pedobacter deserti TaxID=2817382 RepID=UPI002109B08E|nr:glycoside hydrolase family 3 N-terminal domain-containing protein [Pedobacter sp. SYSU D00382]
MDFKYIIALSTLITAFFSAGAQSSYLQALETPNPWVDSVFKSLNKTEKIAQLFFVRAHTNRGKAYEDSVAKVIKRERIGGLVFFQGGPGRQAVLTNTYQSLAEVPLLIMSDGEWGLGMRLDSTIAYPYQMALGAIQQPQLLYRMGQEIAKDYKRIGMHMNLAPDVDINNNINNPVINYRSFGDNKYHVTARAGAYMKGMQDGGLLVTLKHFPGHGDTDVDSHYDLPLLPFSRERLDSLEIYPFRELIQAGAAGVMIAHMNIPALDPTKNIPSTLSRPIVQGILKDGLGFKGLVVTDAMEMKGVVKHFPEGEADVMSIVAGNDILELSENSRRGIRMVRRAVRQERIPMERIDESVKKILTAKYWAGLHTRDTINEHHVYDDVNRAESIHLRKELANAAMTMVKGKSYINTLSSAKRTVIVAVGTPDETLFQRELRSYYSGSTTYRLDKNASANQISAVMRNIGTQDQIIVSIHDTRVRPGNNIPLSADLKMFIRDMAARKASFALFANPYNLAVLPGLEQAGALLLAYQKEDFMQQAAADVFKNKLVPTGKLPVTINAYFKAGDGE